MNLGFVNEIKVLKELVYLILALLENVINEM